MREKTPRETSQMRWLITGGCGFIGASLVEALSANGAHEIRILDNLTVGRREALGDDFHLTKPKTLLSAQAGGSAWSAPIDLIVGDVNDAALVAAAAAARCRGSSSPRRMARSARASCQSTRPWCLVWRPFTAPASWPAKPITKPLASPRWPCVSATFTGRVACISKGVIAKLIHQALNDEPLEIHGDGSLTRAFLNIGDLVRAIIATALAEGMGGEFLGIGGAVENTIGEVLDFLVPIPATKGISGVRLRHTAPRPRDTHRRFSDTSKAERTVSWFVGEMHTETAAAE